MNIVCQLFCDFPSIYLNWLTFVVIFQSINAEFIRYTIYTCHQSWTLYVKMFYAYNIYIIFFRHREQTFRHGWEGRGGGRCVQRLTWTFTIPHVKPIANGDLSHDSGNSNRGSGTVEKGGMGREMGRSFRREGTFLYLWLILVGVWQKATKFCKAIILQLKN